MTACFLLKLIFVISIAGTETSTGRTACSVCAAPIRLLSLSNYEPRPSGRVRNAPGCIQRRKPQPVKTEYARGSMEWQAEQEKQKKG